MNGTSSVTREEFDALRQQVDSLQATIRALEAKLSPGGAALLEEDDKEAEFNQEPHFPTKYSGYKTDLACYGMPFPLAQVILTNSKYLAISDVQAFEELKAARDRHFPRELSRPEGGGAPDTAWLERFLYAGAQEDVSVRNMLLLNFSKDFIRQASTRARIILQEMNIPTHKKSILPTRVGGIAGGTKYLDHNILFKFADDPRIGEGRHLYGGFEPDPERAAKAAANDLKGADAYFRCFTLFGRIPVVVPPQVLLDFNGFRLIAMPWLPLASASLVYGSSDGGREVHDNDDVLRAAMKFSAHHMHLALHTVQNQELFAAGDIEVHKASDGRFYLIDLARTFPPEDPSCSNHLPQSASTIFFRMHRAEYMDYLKSKQDVSRFPPLSPDSFSVWGKAGAHIHNRNAQQATDHLIRVRLPELVTFMQNSKQLPANLGQMLHHWGISVRHLGLLRSIVRDRNEETSSPLELRLLMCMVERCCKNLLRQDMREAALSKNVNDAIATFLNAVTQHSTEESVSFWTVKLPKDLLSRFGHSALFESEEHNLMSLCKPHITAILKYVCTQTGISLAAGWSQPDFVFTRDSVLSTSVRSKTLNVLEELLHEDTIVTACLSKNNMEFTVALTKLARKATGNLANLIDNLDDLEKVQQIFDSHSESQNVKNVHLCVLAALALHFGGCESISTRISHQLRDQWAVALVPRLPQLFSSAQAEHMMTARLCILCQREQVPSGASELALSLINAKADPNGRIADTKDPMLLECIVQGHESLVETLLEAKADCNAKDRYGKSIEQILGSYFSFGTTHLRIRQLLMSRGLFATPPPLLSPVRVRVHSLLVALTGRPIEAMVAGAYLFRVKLPGTEHKRRSVPTKALEENKTVLAVHADFMFEQWPDHQELKCSIGRGKTIVATLRLKRPSKPFLPLRDAMIPTSAQETPFALVADIMYAAPETRNSLQLAPSASFFSFFYSKRESVNVGDRQKVAILGTSESGKSTLFKLLCGFPFSIENKKYYGDVIRKNVIQAAKILIEASKERLHNTLPDNTSSIAFVENFDEEQSFIAADVLPHLVATLTDPGIQKTRLDRTALQLPDCADVFFPKISDIFTEGYVPTDEDILASRVRTTGITQSLAEGWSVFDVGGSRAEQKKWVQLYEAVTCVVFTVNITCYDREESKANRMAESLTLWESIATHAALSHATFVLLFTFDNAFRQKVRAPPQEGCFFFAELTQAQGSYSQATAAITARFFANVDTKRKRAFCVDLLDDQSYTNAIRAVREFVAETASG